MTPKDRDLRGKLVELRSKAQIRIPDDASREEVRRPEMVEYIWRGMTVYDDMYVVPKDGHPSSLRDIVEIID